MSLFLLQTLQIWHILRVKYTFPDKQEWYESKILTNSLDCVLNISRKRGGKSLTQHCWLTDDEEEDKADDEEWGAADGHTACKLDEGWQQQRGPEQEVEQRPGSAAGDYCRSRKLSHLVVMFLQGILTTSGQGRSVTHSRNKCDGKARWRHSAAKATWRLFWWHLQQRLARARFKWFTLTCWKSTEKPIRFISIISLDTLNGMKS